MGQLRGPNLGSWNIDTSCGQTGAPTERGVIHESRFVQRRCPRPLARFQSLELEVTTNRGAVTATFDLEGTADMLRQVACPA